MLRRSLRNCGRSLFRLLELLEERLSILAGEQREETRVW